MRRSPKATFGPSSAVFFAVMVLGRLTFADEPRPSEGFRVLFNGKDLSGWYGNNPHETANIEATQRNEAIAGFQEEFRNVAIKRLKPR